MMEALFAYVVGKDIDAKCEKMGDLLEQIKEQIRLRDRRIGYLEECMRQIANIENKMVGGDWDEIEEARRIAIRALGDGK